MSDADELRMLIDAFNMCKNTERDGEPAIVYAIKKQIPQSPMHITTDVNYWNCPLCHVLHKKGDYPSYCRSCGQAIDWSKEGY